MLYHENRIRPHKTYSLWSSGLTIGSHSWGNNKVGDSSLTKFIKLKLGNWLLLALVIIMTFVVAVGIVAMVKPYDVMTFQPEPYKILTKDIHPGENIKMQIVVTKNLAYPIRVSRQLVNHYIYLYSETLGNNPIGPIENTITLSIPEYAEIGQYYIRSTYIIKVNALREIVYTHDSETFEVTKKQ